MLLNGVIIETKGQFTASDRRKHQETTSKLDSAFVFENGKRKLRKAQSLHMVNGVKDMILFTMTGLFPKRG